EQRSRPSVVDEVLNRLARGQNIALAQLKDAGRRFRRGVLRSLVLALGVPLFPFRKRLMHQLVGRASDAGGERGKAGFLIGRETNYHVIQGSVDRWRVKE